MKMLKLDDAAEPVQPEQFDLLQFAQRDLQTVLPIDVESNFIQPRMSLQHCCLKGKLVAVMKKHSVLHC